MIIQKMAKKHKPKASARTVQRSRNLESAFMILQNEVQTLRERVDTLEQILTSKNPPKEVPTQKLSQVSGFKEKGLSPACHSCKMPLDLCEKSKITCCIACYHPVPK